MRVIESYRALKRVTCGYKSYWELKRVTKSMRVIDIYRVMRDTGYRRELLGVWYHRKYCQSYCDLYATATCVNQITNKKELSLRNTRETVSMIY